MEYQTNMFCKIISLAYVKNSIFSMTIIISAPLPIILSLRQNCLTSVIWKFSTLSQGKKSERWKLYTALVSTQGSFEWKEVCFVITAVVEKIPNVQKKIIMVIFWICACAEKKACSRTLWNVINISKLSADFRIT